MEMSFYCDVIENTNLEELYGHWLQICISTYVHVHTDTYACLKHITIKQDNCKLSIMPTPTVS